MKKKNSESEQELQQKYAEVQLINEQVQQLQQKLNLIQQQIQQLNEVIFNLEGFKEVKKDSTLMFTIGPGIYGKGTLKENSLIVNVGGNVLINKSVPEAISIIKTQIKELGDILNQDEQAYTISVSKLQELQTEIANIQKSK